MCHTDTVPYSTDWRQALEPFVADGLLHGCGACDVKGFLTCLLTSIVESDPSSLIDGLCLILTADEEIGCVGAAHLVASGLIKPRRVVVGEPTSLHPARAGKGCCLAEVTVFGEEAHSAHPQKGKSAIYRAARLITAPNASGVAAFKIMASTPLAIMLSIAAICASTSCPELTIVRSEMSVLPSGELP